MVKAGMDTDSPRNVRHEDPLIAQYCDIYRSKLDMIETLLSMQQGSPNFMIAEQAGYAQR